MKNLDTLKANKAEQYQKMTAAVEANDPKAFAESFQAYCDTLEQAVLAESKGYVQAVDNTVLAGRGVRALTSEEKQYYEAFAKAARSANPRQAVTDMEVVMPETIIDSVFDDLVDSHPLLDAIGFQNTAGLIEILVNTGSAELAAWGPLDAEIVKELTRGFDKINLAQTKLSAFIPIAKSMLDLGPVWIDRFIRALLSEAIYNGLEAGIIDGTGKNMPIGMTRDLEAPVVEGEYAKKSAIALTTINPKTYGALAAEIAKGPNGIVRKATNLIMVVNPIDYLNKVMPATTFQREDGTYNSNIFPIPTTVIESARLAEGEAVLGIAKKYFMGIGLGKSGKIDASDEYRFLEDERVYLTKFYGTGRPLDNAAFLRLDISGLTSVWDEKANP